MSSGRSVARRWSQRVTETSHALDLEPDVFTWSSPRRIAESLRRSALKSQTRKAEPFRSALSMLDFYVNRAGRTLRPERREILRRAKEELYRLFGRAKGTRSRHATRAKPQCP